MFSQFFQNLKQGFQNAEDIMSARQDYRHSVIDPEFYKNVRQGYQGPDRSVKGNKKVNIKGAENVGEFVHKGLAQRSFQRVWTITDDTEVGSVSFNDGLLNVELNKIVPEHHTRKDYL